MKLSKQIFKIADKIYDKLHSRFEKIHEGDLIEYFDHAMKELKEPAKVIDKESSGTEDFVAVKENGRKVFVSIKRVHKVKHRM